MSVRIFRLVSKICVKNILRIFQAHFRENVKNTEPGRKFHHSYKKKRVHAGSLSEIVPMENVFILFSGGKLRPIFCWDEPS